MTNAEQPNPRIVKALEEQSESLAEVVEAILAEGHDIRDSVEMTIAQGFALGMEYMMDAGDKTVSLDRSAFSVVKGALTKIDQYLLDHPQAQHMLNELRRPLAGYIQQQIASTREQFIKSVSSAYGHELAVAVVDGEQLTDEQKERLALRDLTAGTFGLLDFFAFATQYPKMPANKCRCLGCQREAFNKSSLSMDTARDEVEKLWPDQRELFRAYGQNRQDLFVRMLRKVNEGDDQGEHFGLDGTLDPQQAKNLAQETLRKMGLQKKD